MSAFDKQVGGSHYKQYAIQPYEFFVRNHITHEKAAIIRRILRHDHETGKGVEDIDKIIHECELIKELLYNKEEVIGRMAVAGVIYAPDCDHKFNHTIDPTSNKPYCCVCGTNYIKV